MPKSKQPKPDPAIEAVEAELRQYQKPISLDELAAPLTLSTTAVGMERICRPSQHRLLLRLGAGAPVAADVHEILQLLVDVPDCYIPLEDDEERPIRREAIERLLWLMETRDAINDQLFALQNEIRARLKQGAPVDPRISAQELLEKALLGARKLQPIR